MERKFEWRSSNGQDYLYAQGQSRHDLGYAIGQGLHRQISAARTLYQAALSRNLENSARELLAQAIAGYQSAIPPQDMEEIMGMREGYSAASGEEMELDELALQSFGIDLTHQLESRGLGTSLTGCTNFACINTDGQNYDSDPKLTIADAFVHQRTASEPEAFLYRPGGSLGMAVGKNEAGVCMTVSVIKSLCPAPVMTPRSVLVRRALRRERSIDSLRAMTDEQGRSPFSYNLIVSDASTVSAAQAIPSEQRICQVKRTLVQSNQFDNEPVICRKKIQDGLGTTVLFFTRESFGRGNPADQPAGQLPL